MNARTSFVYRILCLSLGLSILPAAAFTLWADGPQQKTAAAQASVAPQDDTPEARMKKFGLTEDPGVDPDPKKVWVRGDHEYTIEKYPKKGAKFDQKEGWVRPVGFVNVAAEIYRQDDQYVWTWMETPESQKRTAAEMLGTPRPDPEGEKHQFSAKYLDMLRKMKGEFSALTPPASNKTVRFAESSDGLPQRGSFRDSLGVADMNEDGRLDLVVPAERGTVNPQPMVYLGVGDGKWQVWRTEWSVPVNYGGIAVGDLNKDGHQDVVVASHLGGLRVFLSDGKGTFTDSSVGLPQDFGSRCVLASDVDADGDLDVVAISEVASGPRQGAEVVPGSRLRAYLNDGKGERWTAANIADPVRLVGGDWLTAANLNNDKYPDFVASSIFFDSSDTWYVSSKKLEWNAVGLGFAPARSFYWASAAGKFTGGKTDDVAVAYGRAWPSKLEAKEIEPPAVRQLVGIDLMHYDGKRSTRIPVVRWESRRTIWGMTSGDFDGDGNLDLAYWHPDPHEIALLLGDGKGHFERATVEGITLPKNTLYDVKAADVNGDGRLDIILMFESTGAERDGAVRVFLNRSTDPATPAQK